jgi:Cys-tRNA(Pro) deacylase
MQPTERVQAAMKELALPGRLLVCEQSTATATEAAAAVECEVGQIVKTLFFQADGRPTLVLCAGDRQVDTALLAPVLGVGRKKLRMGTPAEVEESTGFAVGGVAPIGLPATYDTVIDESLRRFETVWAAAGSTNAVFEATTEALALAVRGQWAAITREPAGSD